MHMCMHALNTSTLCICTPVYVHLYMYTCLCTPEYVQCMCVPVCTSIHVLINGLT